MKKLALLLVMLMSLNVMLPIYANEEVVYTQTPNLQTQTEERSDSDTVPETTDDITETDIEIIEETNTEFTLTMLETMRQNILDQADAEIDKKSQIRIQSNNPENVFLSYYKIGRDIASESQVNEIKTYANMLCDLIASLAVADEREVTWQDKQLSTLGSIGLIIRGCMADGSYNTYSSYVYVHESFVEVKCNGEIVAVEISDGQKVLDFLENTSFTSLNRTKYDEQTPEYRWKIEKGENSYNQILEATWGEDIYPYVLIDSTDFTFKVPEEIKNPVLEEIANSGETVTGKFENYDPTTKGYQYNYHLILSGSKGAVELLTEERVSLDGSKELYSYNHPVGFINAYRIENNMYVEYQIGKSGTTNLKLTFADGDIKEVLFDDIVCENLEHKIYSDSSYLSDRYVEKTEEDKEALIKEQQENVIEPPVQDPERSVSTYKGIRGSDGRVFDYTIPYIVEIPIDFTENSMPSWYKALGEDVKVILIGMNQTIDGTSCGGRTMVKFEGSKGEQWFGIDSVKWDKKENTASVKNTYNSLISFDGVRSIRNTVEFDTVGLDAYFEGADYELASIVIKIGGKTIEVSADNIKYIGGGKATYENIF